MALVGNLRDFSLSDFLYLIDRGYKTGCLYLDRDNDSAVLYFNKGKLTAMHGKAIHANLADLLVQLGKLSPEQAARIVELRGNNGNGGTTSDVVVHEGWLSREDLQAALQSHTEEAVYKLFGWPDGEFRFEQNQMPAPTAPLMPTPLAVENLIMEGVRRIDEWGQIKERIPSTDLLVRFVEQPSERGKGINLASDEWRVFARINGKDTLAEIAKLTKLSEFDVCRIVYGFITAGLAEVVRQPRPVTGDAQTRAGAKAAAQGRPKRGLVSRIIQRIRGM
jgi:hypothetical protein